MIHPSDFALIVVGLAMVFGGLGFWVGREWDRESRPCRRKPWSRP